MEKGNIKSVAEKCDLFSRQAETGPTMCNLLVPYQLPGRPNTGISLSLGNPIYVTRIRHEIAEKSNVFNS